MKSMEELMILLPNAQYIGMYTDPRVNNGMPTPMFTSKPREDGKPSINTVEGWLNFVEREPV